MRLGWCSNEKSNVLVLGQRKKAFDFARQLAEINPALDKIGTMAHSRHLWRTHLLVDRAVAHETGRLRTKRPPPIVDGLLAETAKIHCMTLATPTISLI